MSLCLSLQIYVDRRGEDKEIKDIALHFKKWPATRVEPQAGLGHSVPTTFFQTNYFIFSFFFAI
jgi:hypothetical protein